MPETIVKKMPPKAELGTLAKVDDPTLSKVGDSIVIPYYIIPRNGGKDVRGWLTFRPEMLQAGFNNQKLEGKFKTFFINNLAYRVNANGRIVADEEIGGKYVNGWLKRFLVPVLAGLHGENVSALQELDKELSTLPAGEIPAALVEGLRRQIGTTVGYFLVQQRKKTDQDDPETGKPVYVDTPYYQLDSFFTPSKKVMDDIIAASKKSYEFSENKVGKAAATYGLIANFTNEEAYAQGSSTPF